MKLFNSHVLPLSWITAAVLETFVVLFEHRAASTAHHGNKAASDLREIFICGDEVRAF